jgi:hypothetical protein
MFFKNARFTSASWISSSASRGCRGKERGFVLQVFIAQVRKFSVRSFIVGGGFEGVKEVGKLCDDCAGAARDSKFWDGRGGMGGVVRLGLRLKFMLKSGDVGFERSYLTIT